MLRNVYIEIEINDSFFLYSRVRILVNPVHFRNFVEMKKIWNINMILDIFFRFNI